MMGKQYQVLKWEGQAPDGRGMPASHWVWDARPFTPWPKFFTVSSSTDFPFQATLKTNSTTNKT
jgi:hypothetical protein